MAHELDGDMTSRTTDLSTVTTDPNKIHLEIDEGSGDLKEGSKHGADKLTGKVVKEGPRHRLEINNKTKKTRFEGVVCAQIGPMLVIAGKKRLNVEFDSAGNPIGDVARKPKEAGGYPTEDSAAFEQEQIIWIATKP